MLNREGTGRETARLRDRRGAVLLFVAVGMVGCLLAAGLALDLGVGYLEKAQISRAVDAAALAGARSIRKGEDVARARALAVASANGLDSRGPVSISVTFGSNEWDERTVAVSASRIHPTLLMKLADRDSMTVASSATAAIPPVDMVLVLDQSGSLGSAGAWDDLQEASRQFVRHFDDDIDQVGMISFNVRAAHHFQIRQPFLSDAVSTINGMHSTSYTNTGEGMRLAFDQFQSASVRHRSAKVVVFFTDGRPTAFRGKVAGQDRVLCAWGASAVDGYWDNPDEVIMDPVVIPAARSCQPGCWGYDKGRVWDQAERDGLYWADQIRAAGIMLYTIGLGDPTRPSWDPLLANPDYLRLLANEDHIADADQPAGKMYFAPGPDDLLRVFNLVAEDLLARLTH